MIVQMELTCNGVDYRMLVQVDPMTWEYPEVKLAHLKRLKARLLDMATAGVEPKVTTYPGDELPPDDGQWVPFRSPAGGWPSGVSGFTVEVHK